MRIAENVGTILLQFEMRNPCRFSMVGFVTTSQLQNWIEFMDYDEEEVDELYWLDGLKAKVAVGRRWSIAGVLSKGALTRRKSSNFTDDQPHVPDVDVDYGRFSDLKNEIEQVICLWMRSILMVLTISIPWLRCCQTHPDQEWCDALKLNS